MKNPLFYTCFLFVLYFAQLGKVKAENTTNSTLTPFEMLRQTVEGKQLLEIADYADYDPALSKHQLDVLANTGIKAKHLTYEVAQYLGYIAIHNALSEFETTKQYLTKLHQIGTKLGNEWVLSLYYHKKSRLALKQGQFLKGLDYSSQAVTIANEINFHELSARAKSVRGVFYSKRGESALALKDFQDALTYFESTQNKSLSMRIYLNLVTLYLDRQEYEKALSASDKVINILQALPRKNIRALAANYINRAIALSYLGKKEQELDAYNTAQNYAIRSNDIETLASIYANLSDYFLRNKQYEKAEEEAKRCIKTSERINNINIIAICQLNQGLASVFMNKSAFGFNLLNTAINTIQKEGMYSTLTDGYLAMVEAYQYLNDDKSANIWLEKYYQHLLEQERSDKAAYFSQVELNFQETVTDRENTYTSVKKSMLTSILSQDALVKNLLITIAVLSTLLIIFIGLTLFYRKKLNNKYGNY